MTLSLTSNLQNVLFQIQRFSPGISEDEARNFLLRSIYEVDDVDMTLSSSSILTHIMAATPKDKVSCTEKNFCFVKHLASTMVKSGSLLFRFIYAYLQVCPWQTFSVPFSITSLGSL